MLVQTVIFRVRVLVVVCSCAHAGAGAISGGDKVLDLNLLVVLVVGHGVDGCLFLFELVLPNQRTIKKTLRQQKSTSRNSRARADDWR